MELYNVIIETYFGQVRIEGLNLLQKYQAETALVRLMVQTMQPIEYRIERQS